MKNKFMTMDIWAICLLGILTGCAGAPKPDADIYTGGAFNNKEFDVLFATEFPVESEHEAFARAAGAMQEGEIDKALYFYVRAL